MIYRATLANIEHINHCLARNFEVDFTEVVSDPLNVILIEKDSGAAFLFRGPGIYEVHVFFDVFGREALSLGRRMLDVMRNDGAWYFWAAVPDESRRVKMFTRLMGWRSKGPIQTRHGPMELFTLENETCHQQ